MISAAEARQFKDNIWQYQLEQIDRAVKETIIAGAKNVVIELTYLMRRLLNS